VLGYPPNGDVDEVFQTVKKEMKNKYNLKVLQSLGFNNTYTLAVKKETAQKYHLKTISDLCKVSNQLIFSPTLMFMNREDCYLGLQKKYPIHFKKVVAIDGAPRYTALMNNECDVIDAYSTDGLLKKFDLQVLEDDQSFFLPYHAIPIVNDKIENNYPEVISLLNKLHQYLNDETMVELNYQVDELKHKPSTVAKQFLLKKHLIKKN
ncbi:MAG: glycine betaine ABC transporter substrate-binding protein, partial [Faecalibacillus sp.]